MAGNVDEVKKLQRQMKRIAARMGQLASGADLEKPVPELPKVASCYKCDRCSYTSENAGYLKDHFDSCHKQHSCQHVRLERSFDVDSVYDEDGSETEPRVLLSSTCKECGLKSEKRLYGGGVDQAGLQVMCDVFGVTSDFWRAATKLKEAEVRT